MILSIHQPAFLPWLGYFHKIISSEVFVILDTVKYSAKGKNCFQNRNRIKSANGIIWLTVPIITKNKSDILIKDAEIDNNQRWNIKIIKSIKNNYSKAKFFNKYFPEIERLLTKKYKNLNDLCKDMLDYFLEVLNCKTHILYASDIDLGNSVKSDLILDICKKLNADKYISGKNGKNYINIQDFSKEDITVIFQNYKHPVYDQLYGEFIPCLSFIDLLFNHGPDSKNIIMGGNELK